MRRTLVLGGLVLALAATARAEGLAGPKKVLHTVHVDKGFIDDAVALSPDGSLVAYVHSDGDVSTLVVEKVGGPVVGRAKLEGLPPIIGRVVFSRDGRHLLVVGEDRERDGRVARVYTTTGEALKGKIGPVTDIDLASLDGQTMIVTLAVKRGKNETSHTIAAYGVSDLKPKKRRTYVTDKQGLVRGLEMRIVAYAQGFLRIVGQRKGEFDKANDIRRPDTISIVDALSGTVIQSTDIADPMAWAEVAALRAERPSAEAFVVVEELKTLVCVGRDHAKREIAIDEKMLKYEPKTLHQQLVGDRLYFSLAVDPVNPDATAKGRTDKPDIDFYAVDLGAAKARRLFRLPSDRPVGWHVAGGKIAVLRKYKSFSRGGVDLEVYPLE